MTTASQIIRKYARKNEHGTFVMCRRRPTRSAKVIYGTHELACECSTELLERLLSSEQQYTYECGDHVHLSRMGGYGATKCERRADYDPALDAPQHGGIDFSL